MTGAPLDRSLEACPHLAVLLHSEDELPGVLASFYALGAKRNGWLVHRARRDEIGADREALAGAGLDVDGLEREDRLIFCGFDPEADPEAIGAEMAADLEAALARGLTALWYARFAVGPEVAPYRRFLAFERSWDARFRGGPVVTLCPYVVGPLDAGETLARLGTVAGLHDGVLVPGEGGHELIASAGRGAPQRA